MKLEVVIDKLLAVAIVGSPVKAKLVASFLGRLHSAAVVCGRAVAILTRGITRTLAKMLRLPAEVYLGELSRLSYILKSVWGGYVIWTAEAHADLLFWKQVSFRDLSAPFLHDRLSDQVTAWVADPKTGKVADDVRVFAVDTSNYASGGGEFLRDGNLWRVIDSMVIRLTDSEVFTSSTFRELLGVLRIDIALIPDSCKKAILVLDSYAAVQCLKFGSSIEVLQNIVRQIFLRQLRHSRVYCPAWVKRSHAIIAQFCDVKSRIHDSHAYTVAPLIFRQANDIAITLWGRGFQLDVCADMHNVQPVQGPVRLPFFSRWLSPWTSGVDMFQQSWRGTVNWCNPPFALVPRVLALLKAQKACAAVMLPLGNNAWWQTRVVMGAPGVLKVFKFDPNLAEHKSGGLSVDSKPYTKAYAVVFFDFSTSPPSRAFCDAPSAQFQSRGVHEVMRYSRLTWPEGASLPRVHVCQD